VTKKSPAAMADTILKKLEAYTIEDRFAILDFVKRVTSRDTVAVYHENRDFGDEQP